MRKQTRQFLMLAMGLSLCLSACEKPKVKPTTQPKPAVFVKPKDLKSTLTPMQYRVTQEDGTEPPFKNAFWDNKEAGIYVDIVSGEALFSSKDKFKSGTGWPSFTRPLIAINVVEKTDKSHGMTRVEVRSKNADSHLGHLFNDGPPPTNQRYCINSASLRFIKVAELEKEGYGQYAGLFGVKIGSGKTEVAVLAAGCFWCLEAIFEPQPGVLSVVSGYTGGQKDKPTYKEVCTGTTGHTEAIEITFDPTKTSYKTLVDLFWRTFDPTDGRGVAPDFGSQYRPAIFYLNEGQKKIAEASMAEQQKKHKKPIATEISPFIKFYKAEDYHQDYVKNNPTNRYVVGVSYRRMDEVGVKHP